MKQFLHVCRFLCALTVITVLSASACSDDDEKTKQSREAWEYESFMIEAYTSEGENPYLDDNGVDHSFYPLGELITRDKMTDGEDLFRISFGNNGKIYTEEYEDADVTWWKEYGTYKIEGNRMQVEDPGVFYPANQTSPAGFVSEEITHEILEWTDIRRSIRQTQLDTNTGTRLIITNNFQRSETI